MFPYPTRLGGFRLLLSLLLSGAVATTSHAQRVAAGTFHTVALHADGTLWAWGNNTYGQLGVGDYTARTAPVRVGSGHDWQQVSAGALHTFGIRQDGTLWAWGNNGYGNLGNGTRANSAALPVQVGTDHNWRSISSTQTQTLGVRTDGTLWAWGSGGFLLGQGTSGTSQLVPVQVGSARNWGRVSALGSHALGVRTDGTLWAWGSNSQGKLGLGLPTGTSLGTPTQVGTATTWVSAAAGGNHSLAVQQDGTLWAWGDNSNGQLGLGPDASQSIPVQVGAATTWKGVYAGDAYTLALRADGSLWGWGQNRYGQAGTTDLSNQLLPVAVGRNGTTWQEVAVGNDNAVGRQQDGTVWTWGHNIYGETGRGEGLQFALAQVGPATTWQTVAGGSDFMLGLRQDGTLWAWGNNSGGQLGLGAAASLNHAVPVQVGTARYQSLAAGQTHNLAVRTDGTLWAWGNNYRGQLGLGSTGNFVRMPTQVGTATTWRSVAVGSASSVGIQVDGSLWAWGYNMDGQLGLGTTTTHLRPVRVGTATNWQTVAADDNSVMATRADGTLRAWGNNAGGQLGLGTSTNPMVPVPVGTATNWASVSVKGNHSLAVQQDGTLWAWGENYSGQLGVGTTIRQPTPVQVGTATTWHSATAGNTHSLGIQQDGSIWTWGSNEEGQLGLGAYSYLRNIPTSLGSSDWRHVAAGAYYSAGIRADGTLWTWGYNSEGQLGYGHPVNPLPLYVASGGAVLATSAATTTAPWQLAPNPAHDRVWLLGLPAGPVAARLFDSQGRLVRRVASAEVPLAGLVPGLYLLRATSAATCTTRTLRLVVE